MKPHLKIALLVVGVLVLAGVLVLLAWKQEQDVKSRRGAADKRIGENVVATYVGGEVTAQELRDYINKTTLRDGEHETCEEHGYDHNKCDRMEKCETHPMRSSESYRQMLRVLVMEKMVGRWIKEKGMLARKDVTHRLKHVVEEINLSALGGKMHSDKLKPDRLEMRQYYEERKDEYRGRPFSDVEKEIEKVLIARKQAEYIPKYIEELKKNAVIERNYDLLKIPDPTEAEVRRYYDERRKTYLRPEAVRVQFMTFGIGGDEKGAREKAEQALAKIRSGGDFERIAQELAEGASTTGYLEKGKPSGRSARFLETVFRYQRGQVTPVFRDGEFLCIARIVDHVGSEQKPLDAVRGEVKAALYLTRERARMEDNKYEALFSIHGKRFTVEQFMQEFDELSAEQKKQFASFEAKKNLLDQLIVKELLVEKGEDQGQDSQEKQYRKEVKRKALEQMLHKEEVDEKIAISDKEARDFYDKYKARLIEPAKAKVSVIRVGLGFSEDERTRAKEGIEQAQAKLQEGTDFAAVAKEYSQDWTATRGGDLDQWIYEGGGQLSEVYEHGFHRHVFALTPGQTSDFFEFRNNYWIVKLRQRVDARQQTFDEARPQIVEALKGLRHEQRSRELENELLEKSRLVVRDFVLSRMLSAESRGHAAENEYLVH